MSERGEKGSLSEDLALSSYGETCRSSVLPDCKMYLFSGLSWLRACTALGY